MTFNGRTTSEEVVEGLALGGRTILITGTSAGIGREAARVLAGAGAEIVAVARDGAKNARAVAAIRALHPAARLHAVTLDLADLAAVRRVAVELLAAHPRIDALINNAGVMGGPFQVTAGGHERHFAINHLGPFLLTNLLVPALRAAAPSRVVILSSAGHRLPGFDIADLHFRKRPYSYQAAYCQSKRANVLHAVALAPRLARFGITVNAVHPGAIRSEVWRDLPAADADAGIGWSAHSGSPEKTASQGAATEVWAAVSPQCAGLSGQYFEDCAVARRIPVSNPGAVGVVDEALDPQTARRLWQVSEEAVGQRFAFS